MRSSEERRPSIAGAGARASPEPPPPPPPPPKCSQPSPQISHHEIEVSLTSPNPLECNYGGKWATNRLSFVYKLECFWVGRERKKEGKKKNGRGRRGCAAASGFSATCRLCEADWAMSVRARPTAWPPGRVVAGDMVEPMVGLHVDDGPLIGSVQADWVQSASLRPKLYYFYK